MFYFIRILLFTALGITIPAIVYTQPEKYRFTRVTGKQGLAHNQVNCIAKDENGFVWIGTLAGLNRYDGYSCKVYSQSGNDTNSLKDNYISTIYPAPDGVLWVNTAAGVTIYNTHTDRFENNYLKYLRRWHLPEGEVNAIQKDGQGDYWFLIAGNLYHYRSQQPTEGQHTSFLQGQAVAIAAFALDNTGHIWIVYRNGYIEQRDKVTNKVLFATALVTLQATGNLQNCFLYADSRGGIWLAGTASTKGVHYIVPGEKGPVIRHWAIPHLIKGITEDAGGTVWIGTDHGGVQLLTGADNKMQYLLNDPADDKTISQNTITAMYKDEQGVIWLGTYKQGLCYYNENVVSFAVNRHVPGKTASLPYDDVNRFAEDNKGNIWIGTNGGGLLYYNPKQKSFIQYRHNITDNRSLCNDVIVSLCIDKTGKLWIGTFYGGLDCFDGKTFTHYRHNAADSNSIADDNIWEVFEDSRGLLWIGTLKAGIDCFDRSSNRFIHYPSYATGSAPRSSYIAAIVEDNRHRLWFGTDAGLDVLNTITGGFTHYNLAPNNFIICLLQDSRGWIWAGTRNGLYILNPEDGRVLASLDKKQGLPDNTVLNLLEDDAQTVWISSPAGISNIVIQKSGDGRPRFRFKNYDELNNLQGRAFNENAALKMKSGLLLFGGPNGFNSVDPLYAKARSALYPLVFTDFQVFNRSVGVGDVINGRALLQQSIYKTDTIRLKYKENDFSVEFAELGFAQSEKDEYAYKLEGFNKDWLLTNGLHRRATYTNLDPGTYLFRIKAADGNGGWSRKEAVLTVIISPPFWKTPLAFVLYAFVVIVSLLVGRKITVDKTRMRFAIEQQQKEAERMHALDMMKIRFFTNVSHEFRTPLSLILSPLEKIAAGLDADKRKQLQLVQRNARRLLNLVNQLLDFRKMEMQEFKLVPSRGDIIAFIKETALSFSDIAEKKDIPLSFHTTLEVFETFFDRDKLEKILFNLLSNAFKFTPPHGKIEVLVSRTPDENGEAEGALQIQVRDNGIGIPIENQARIFERFFQSDISDAVVNQGSGIGLAITKEFVKLHGGEIRLESEVNKGSCFFVVLPLQPAASMLSEALPEPAAIVAAGWLNDGKLPDVKEEAVPEIIKHKTAKNTILLVEDNEDFRFYLKENLRHWFVIMEAANGKEGWKQIQARQPDLVVTDIMMPQMNGLELARKVRMDPRTSHIPVVLLTAMSTEEQELEGFETGANDYIAKPFNFEILLSRLRNLLLQRKMVRKEFMKKLEINPAEIAVTPLDEKFMQQALEVVEQHISDPDFSVEELSRLLHLSRVALYKKLLSLTGKTPIEFIRLLRLKRAARLLSVSQLTVAEVAYEVGFNNPKYFARYFKEAFGVLPSQYKGTL